jgi:hypothetical protein
LDDRTQPAARHARSPDEPRARHLHQSGNDGLQQRVQIKKQFSSGIVEGLNNKAKVTMRKAYGYKTFRIAELSLYQCSAGSRRQN